MDPKVASKYILKKLLVDFETYKDLPNQEFLEKQLQRLYQMTAVYKSQEINADLACRQRALARDKHQNCLGLINGIKFGISFWLHENDDLMETDPSLATVSVIKPDPTGELN